MTPVRLRRAMRERALRWFPAIATTLFSIRSRRLSHRLVKEWGTRDITARIVAHQGLTVAAGPFQGLALPPGTQREHLSPFLLGTYESELHPWLEELRGARISRVLDVGAKFGYYAIGISRWFPEADSIAFDTDPWARRMLRSAAAKNGIARLEVRGYLEPGEIVRYLVPSTFVLSDCEGFEARLFEGVPDAALASCWLLIELHEEVAPGVNRALQDRFSASHDVRVKARTGRVPGAALIELLGPEDATTAVREFRGDQTWIFCRPKVSGHSRESSE